MSKTKIQFEYPMHCQSEILFEYMATAEGLSEWFADDVTEKGDDFFFSWNGGPAEKATLTRYKTESFVRFRWEEDEETKYYFEMAIAIDEITNDLSLNITDFCQPGDEEECRLYWENLIENLQIKLGAA
ncbi:MAG: SRPBCC domain-containing protein [Cloacibacterium sp.]|nr:SRPBCC domain-containing protein [Cloacibacterium sp.]